MSGERFDHGSERQRHERFVGRAGLLARLDELLVDGDTDRWVVVTGAPGAGKTALVAEWVARREAAGAMVPHHFLRRGEYDRDDPGRLVGSLVAQIEAHAPALREPETHARLAPAARLAAVLARAGAGVPAPRPGWLAAIWSRVSVAQARRHSRRLVVVIDGLDEYDPPAASGGDPLAAFLPAALPRGVSFLCTGRAHLVPSFAMRDGALAQIDLDAPDSAADNEATVRAFWKQVARPLGVDAHFVDEAVARAGGNLQHAVMLQQQLADGSATPRRAEDIPRGLEALLAAAWQRLAHEPIVAAGLGVLCAAREALTLEELGAAAGWPGDAERQAFAVGAGELVTRTRRTDGAAEYRLQHDAIRAYITGAIGARAVAEHHGQLARTLARWPDPAGGPARRYAVRHALGHRAQAGDWADAWRVAADPRFLEAKCREHGVAETEAELARLGERCRASGDVALGRRFGVLARALAREASWLRLAPEAIDALVWNRLRRSGLGADDLGAQLGAAGARFLRVRHVATRESPALVRDLAGHAGAVNACAVTADGRRVVSVSNDGTLRAWDLETGRALAILKGHAREMRGCAITADGRRAISASDDRTLKVWDLEARRVLATLVGHTDEVNACAVTADGLRVVSASSDGTLKVWDLETGSALATMAGHTDWVTGCAVTADGRRVISASADQTLRIWDLATGQAVATLEGHADRVNACVVTADGSHAIAALWDGTLQVWDLDAERVHATLVGHRSGVNACGVTGDGQRGVSASNDGTLKVWDLASGQAIATLEGHVGSVNACAVTADGRRAVSGANDRTLKVWDLETGASPWGLDGHSAGVNACAATPDGRRVVSASNDGTLKIWDLETGRARAILEGHRGGVNACAVTADGRRVISGANDGTLKIWDLERRRAVVTLRGHTERVLACAVTADGRRAVSGSEDRTLKVWDVESEQAIWTLDRHAAVNACAVTADGRRAISASQDRALKVWDLETGQAVATLEGHVGVVNGCAVTADGRRAISASWDRTLRVWELEAGGALATLKGHAGPVNGCAVTADGRWLISASDDRTLRVWDLETGELTFTHRGDAAYTTVAATESVIIAGDAAGAVWFLDWPAPD